MELEELTQQIIAAAIEVHKELGAGLLESSCERCLCHELSLRGIPHVCELQLPVNYKGMRLDCGCRVDIVVANAVVLEMKAVERVEKIHKAQLLIYLRLGGWKVGLLINFNVPVLKDGIKRRVLLAQD
ncbi:MAG TPA: GxxExxY protein [Tepidisphaeraceae bacterium]|nr:GxxExxY protein [Tepidisphaeraceae bacterium]